MLRKYSSESIIMFLLVICLLSIFILNAKPIPPTKIVSEKHHTIDHLGKYFIFKSKDNYNVEVDEYTYNNTELNSSYTGDWNVID